MISAFRSFVRSVLCLGCFVSLLVTSQAAHATELFPRPAGLEDAVQFWLKVYTQVDTNAGYIHDNKVLGVVYETVRFGNNKRKRARNQQLKQRKQHYKTILLQLAKGKRSGLSKEQRRVLALWPKGVSNATLQQAAQRIRFQLGQSNKFREGLVRSGTWRPYLRKVFGGMGLPEQLIALPHVESSFNPAAYSHVGAAGMWQFTRSTGRRFMRVDYVVDERLDPYLSTQAAARLLAHNYSITSTWPLALTAYNHGVAGMRRASRKLGTTDIETIVDQYKSRSFGFASRNFYAAFLAALEIDQHPEAYFGVLKRNAFQPDLTVEVSDYIKAESLARTLGVSMQHLREQNRALLAPVWSGEKYIPKGYPLRVPQNLTQAQVVAALNRLPAAERFVAQVPDVTYKVRSGNTLSQIARRYNVSVQQLMQLNQLRSRHRIRVGQLLRLPQASRAGDGVISLAQRDAVAAPTSSNVVAQYQVRKGDTLSKIAHRHGVSEGQLLALNALSNKNRIYVGQRLRLVSDGEAINRSTKLESKQANKSSMQVAEEPEAEIAEQRSELELAEASEPVTAADSEELAPTTLAVAHADLSADPSDYSVAKNGTIEVQASETLGHYAEWLGIRAQALRKLNRLRYGRALVIGKRLKLTFKQVDADTFENKRIAYHRAVQEEFFTQYTIIGTQIHKVKTGQSLWVLAQSRYKIPVWLLRQYNPDLDLNKVQPGVIVNFPRLARRESSDSA